LAKNPKFSPITVPKKNSFFPKIVFQKISLSKEHAKQQLFLDLIMDIDRICDSPCESIICSVFTNYQVIFLLSKGVFLDIGLLRPDIVIVLGYWLLGFLMYI
jgi:hypothetical protein